MSTRRGRGRPRHDDILTPAEWRIANAVRHGLGNAAIARRMDVSADAVKFHVANILAKLGLADRAALRLWAGAPKQSALRHGGSFTMNDNAPFGTIGQISRLVPDLETAEAWYRDMLGLRHLFRAGGMSFFQCGEVRLMLRQAEPDQCDGYVLYFEVPDIEAAHASLSERGVAFVSAPHMIHRHDDGTEEWMAFFSDCAGQTLALMSRVRPD